MACSVFSSNFNLVEMKAYTKNQTAVLLVVTNVLPFIFNLNFRDLRIVLGKARLHHTSMGRSKN